MARATRKNTPLSSLFKDLHVRRAFERAERDKPNAANAQHLEPAVQAFVAAVSNAERDAAAATKAGFPQTASDMIDMALCDLWTYLTAQGRRSQVQEIVDRYVEFDAAGDPHQL